ncbi:MAG: T9SS type A sorting domain-containing protein [candidate division KSB1 bacterium]|nr:T9SS type A sorting domain-containing protein [candidate division KSB1 bacterium]
MGAFPQIADWNEDGKKDLLVGDTNGNITLYTNTGTNSNPVLSKSGFIQAGGVNLDVGSRATPVVVDWNNDGKKDLLSGNSSGYVLLYLNVGSNSSPSFGSATYITAGGSNIIHSESCCEVCDLDADGKKDLLVGDYNGNIYFYSNTGTDANPAFGSGTMLQAGSGNLDVSYYARFDAVDWDEDGDRDLVVGDWDANVYLFLNTSGPAGRITVTSPNGGEVWDERSTQEITWSSSGTSGKVNIRITADGGKTWSSIFQGTDDDGSFWWTIGYVDSNETDCRIKVEDTNNLNLSDVSDRYFTIRDVPTVSITVDQPNGGEVWNEKTSYQIKWHSQNTCGYVALFYSLDGGNSWTTITTSTPDDGVENWTTPEVSIDQTNCRIKVQDRNNSSYWDMSNASFTIKNVPVGSITVVQPNGGEIWYLGNSMDIKWNSQNNSGSVKIELSRNGGSTWETLIASTPDDGTHLWAVTGPASTNCRIRISDIDGNPSDISDNAFTIKESFITITSPNGGETWRVGTTQTITWISAGTSGQVKIELSRNGGSTWEILFANTPDDQTQAWSVTAPAATNCLLKISDVDGSPMDQSDGVFAIRLQPEWSTPITISGGNITFIRTFGGDAAGTDGYDASLDVPTTLPATGYYAYFEIGSSPTSLDTDIRKWASPYAAEIAWTLKITNAIGITSTLSWNAATLPSVGNFTLIGSATSINMRAQTSVSVSGNAVLTIKYNAGVTFNFPRQGWYLISLPVTPTNNNLNALFPTAIGAYSYNSATGMYETATTLEPRKGYWLLIPAATTATVSGASFTGFTQYYAAGWHLIGSVAGGADFTNPNDNPNGAIFAAHGYDPATGYYFQIYPPGSGRLEEKQGYWLAVMQPCYLTIGSGATGSEIVRGTSNAASFGQQFGALPPSPPAVTMATAQSNSAPAGLQARCFPNPFNAEALIEYELPSAGITHIQIYNSMGQRIRSLFEQRQGPGKYAITWDGKNDNLQAVANGIYFYRIEHSGQVLTEKIILLK